MSPGANKMLAAGLLVAVAIALDVTSSYSPIPLPQLVISFALAIAGAIVAIRGIFDFISERFQ
ncbi:MAG: hypothetical protein PXY39_04030 [archaeon]|nr:hypothetical protein [archaeon]